MTSICLGWQKIGF